LLDDLFAISPLDSLRSQPIANCSASFDSRLRALELARLAMHRGTANPGGSGPADNLIGADSSPAGKEPGFGRSLKFDEEMAQQRRAAVQRFRKVAQASSGLVNCLD
jgi:hypothetical protein